METTYKLLPHQLKSLQSKARIAGIYGARGMGKSFYLSIEAMLSLVNGERCIIFAQTYRSLSMNLFREILKRCEESGIPAQLHQGNMTITYGNGIIFGFSYDNIVTVRGATEIHKLLLDEIAYAPNDLFATVAPCLRGTGTESKIRFASSPKKGSYWDRWILSSPEIEWFGGKQSDNIFLSQADLELSKAAIKDEMLYRQEILGEILDNDAEFAIIKSNEYPIVKGVGNIYSIGIDCAGLGADNNVFVVTDGCSVIEEIEQNIGDTFALSNIATELIEKYKPVSVNIDITGSTVNGLYDMLKLRHGNIIHGINFAQAAIMKDKYANARAEMYFNLADKIRSGFYISPESEIRDILSVTAYNQTSNGKFILIPKAEIKEIIGHSPDAADALALALYEVNDKPIYNSPNESLNIALKFVGV